MPYYLATTLKMETVIDKKAIWDKDTALESAIDGHASPPLPPSRFRYITASPVQIKIIFYSEMAQRRLLFRWIFGFFSQITKIYNKCPSGIRIRTPLTTRPEAHFKKNLEQHSYARYAKIKRYKWLNEVTK